MPIGACRRHVLSLVDDKSRKIAFIFQNLLQKSQQFLIRIAGAASVDIERIAKADAWFGATAGLVLVTGALRAAFGAKGWAFYAHNPAFHVKVTLFVIVGLVSIAPTLQFMIKDSPCYVGLNKDEPNLLGKINEIIANAKSAGELGKLSEKWLKAPLPPGF